MRKVECVGMVGKLPTPEGLLMFYDTGRCLTPVELAEALAFQHTFFSNGIDKGKVTEKLLDFVAEIAHKVNVYPVGQAAIASDGRILVTEPWFESEEP